MNNQCFFCESDTEPLRRFWLHPENWEIDRTLRVEQVCEDCDHQRQMCDEFGQPEEWTVVVDCWFCHAAGFVEDADHHCVHCDVFSDIETAVEWSLMVLAVTLFGRVHTCEFSVAPPRCAACEALWSEDDFDGVPFEDSDEPF